MVSAAATTWQPHSCSPVGQGSERGLQDWADTQTLQGGLFGQPGVFPPCCVPQRVFLCPGLPTETRHQAGTACQFLASLVRPPSAPADHPGTYSWYSAAPTALGGEALQPGLPTLPPAPQGSGCPMPLSLNPELTSVALSPHQRHCSVRTVPRSRFSAETKRWGRKRGAAGEGESE